MKTRINVAVRLRPLLQTEIDEGDTSNILHLDETENSVKYIIFCYK